MPLKMTFFQGAITKWFLSKRSNFYLTHFFQCHILNDCSSNDTEMSTKLHNFIDYSETAE